MGLALRRSCGWEDPALIPEPGSNGEILVFEASGDDALGLLDGHPVTAILPNAAAAALLDLKRAAARHLPLQSVKSLLGFGHFGRRVWFYHYVRPYVSDATRTLWDADEAAVRGGICEVGDVEGELHRLRRLLPVLVGARAAGDLAAAQTVEAHRGLLEQTWRRRWRAALAIAAPRAARAADGLHDGAPDAFGAALAQWPLRESPFAAHALLGAADGVTLVDVSGTPPARSWLSTAGLARAKANIDALAIEVAPRAEVLARPSQWSLIVLGRAPLTPDEANVLPRRLTPGGRALGWGPPPPGAALVTGDRGIFPGKAWVIGR